jgi:hypothetical protein
VILERLAGIVREDGGLLAAALRDDIAGATPYGDAVARGPRADGHTADLALVIEAVREGYLLHYGEPRLMSREDDDLALLAGDLDAVQALADLIALSAQAQAAGDMSLADAVWAAGCAELGWGSNIDLQAAKVAARAGETDAAQRLGAAARHIAGSLAPNR